MMYLYFFAIALFMLLCFVLCFVVLLQEGKGGGGLGASFGGDAGDSLFGTATSDVLRTFTGWLVVLFFGFCVILSFWTASIGRAPRKQSLPEYTVETIEK